MSTHTIKTWRAKTNINKCYPYGNKQFEKPTSPSKGKREIRPLEQGFSKNLAYKLIKAYTL